MQRWVFFPKIWPLLVKNSKTSIYMYSLWETNLHICIMIILFQHFFFIFA